jgi:phosphate transport system substrate-binding protein
MTLRTRQLSAIAAAVGAALIVAACGSSSSSAPAPSGSSGSSGGGASSDSGTINGAGSTFAAPIYEQWGSSLKGQGLTINFNAVGSGAGVAQLQAGTVDFAGSDPAEQPSEVSQGKGPVAQFPIGFGAVTVSYNLSGIKSGIKLDGKTLADIFQGKVKTWNSSEIKALNPGMNLPSTAITVVHRSDSSGTTKAFTTFLSANSPAWTAAAGQPDKIVKWPTGTGAKGNSGVAAAIKQTAGAIGYVEQAYALQNGFTYASLKNSSGKYVAPSLSATSAAAVGIKVPADLAISTINSPNAAAYPIVSQTFLIAYRDMCKAGLSKGTASSVKKFFTYALGTGQSVLKQLFYAPLPPNLLAKNKAQLATLTCNGSPLQ